MKVAIRTDASLAIGSGHVARCRALAVELERRGARAEFFEHGKTIPSGFDWLVVDHYELDAAWETAHRPLARRMAAIDDLGRAHDCDLLLDQNWFPDAETRYAGRVPARSRRLLGPRYALLRPEFAAERARLAPRSGEVRRVLVSLGGVDAANDTAKAIRALRALDRPHLAVDVVIGEANPHHAEIAALCAAPPAYTLHRQAPNMAELMVGADFAIGAGGTTTWERCCLGLPTLQLVVAENQEAPTRALAAAGLVFRLESLSADAIRGALESPEALKKQARRMQELVDGQGARRVAAALLASPQSTLTLRTAQPADCGLYFAWANDPEVRRQSLDGRPIEREGHERWFAARLADAVLLVAEDEAGVPAGQARFERRDGAWRVNYSMAAEFRGAGLGAKMLAMAIVELRRRDPAARLLAEVKADNAASRRVFEALGFAAASPTLFELAP